MSKYIIEVDDNAVGGLFKVKGFAMAFDKDGLDKLQKYEEKETADSREFPRKGDTYFYMLPSGEIFESVWDNDDVDNKRLALGSVFKSEKDTEFEGERRKVLAEMSKFAEPFGTKWDGEAYHYYILQYTDENCLSVDSHTIKRSGELYFESNHKARECIEAVGEDRIKKFYIGVE